MAHETNWEARCRLAQECGELEARLREASEQLAVFRCERIVLAARRHETLRTDFNGVPVVCEFECTPECGDGWNEPREPASIELIYVWLGGRRIDAEEFTMYWQDRWIDEFDEKLADAAEHPGPEFDAFEDRRAA